MNTTKATPGPWHHVKTGQYANHIIAADIGRTLYIAKVFGSGGENGCAWQEIDSANAALIASAPALLAENQRLREALLQVIAALQQPVQTSSLREPATADILRGDCAVAVRMAQAALAGKGRNEIQSLYPYVVEAQSRLA